MYSRPTLVLVGPPNSGKTSLYNLLTNSKFKTVNYPGATVEYSKGTLIGSNIQVIDTPGTYSLAPKSADEAVTAEILSLPDFKPLILSVVDGTQLSRHLLFAKQISDSGFKMVMVVTMTDLLEIHDIHLNLELLESEFHCRVVAVSGTTAKGLETLMQVIQSEMGTVRSSTKLAQWTESELNQKMNWVRNLAKKCLSEEGTKKLHAVYDPSFKIDQKLLHPIWGLPIFALVMFLLFSCIFWLAHPFMNLTDSFFTWIAEQLSIRLPAGQFNSFLNQGIVGGLGAVMVFVPQIFILFLGIGFLEATGYLARAATIIDKPFSKLGMSGRAFVPVLSGFACAVPAIMACRNLATERERKIASFILPFMTCSARLPVYTLLLSFIFTAKAAWLAGVVLSGIYLLSLITGGLAAALLNRMLPTREPSFFMMELPLYRRPNFSVLWSGTYDKTKAYIKKAGPIIFIFSVLIWTGTHFPKDSSLEKSYLGQVGRVIEPIVKPLGGDWRVGMGLISAFTARETFVSSLAVLMNVDEQEGVSQQQSLLAKMREAVTSEGTPLFTVPSIVALIVFFILAMQCLSTFSIVLKELGSLRFALGQLLIFNFFAYISAVACFQILK